MRAKRESLLQTSSQYFSWSALQHQQGEVVHALALPPCFAVDSSRLPLFNNTPKNPSLFSASIKAGSIEPVVERRPVRYGFEGYAVVFGLLCVISAVGSVALRFGWKLWTGRALGPETSRE